MNPKEGHGWRSEITETVIPIKYVDTKLLWDGLDGWMYTFNLSSRCQVTLQSLQERGTDMRLECVVHMT